MNGYAYHAGCIDIIQCCKMIEMQDMRLQEIGAEYEAANKLTIICDFVG